MFNRKESKKIAKQKLKEHYIIFVVACLIASFIGASYASSTLAYKTKNEVSQTETIELNDTSVLSDIVNGNSNKGELDAQKIEATNKSKDDKLGLVSVGYRRGVLAGLANTVSTGSIYLMVYRLLNNTFKTSRAISTSLVVLVYIVSVFVIAIIKGLYNITLKRIFLEAHNYKEVKAPRFLFLTKTKKLLKASLVCLLKYIYDFLWGLTIIGGIIKYYSYSQAYFITAENPNIKANDAITLSRKMMKGHKFELFKYDLTFIGWTILNALTFGVTGILYSNPYKEAFLTEYYVYLRGLAKENNLQNSELLDDKYLYEYADKELLKKTYSDIYDLKDIEVNVPILTGIKGFFARKLGIILSYNDEFDAFNKALREKNKHETYKDIFNLENFPSRLGLNPEDIDFNFDEGAVPFRQYSLTSLIIMFFFFSFVGWSWEVFLHIVEDGVFVNRGTMHGPWLPIYGGGLCLILTILYRTRRSLPLHFFSSIALCGVVEYFSSYMLEITKGMKWWDYTGYFLNINGRVCAEGLLIFGIGGTACAYLLAPVIDNLVRKLSTKKACIISIILVLLFGIDFVYSQKVPNVGKGITDYEDLSLDSEFIEDEIYNL